MLYLIVALKKKIGRALTFSFHAYVLQEEQNQKNLSQSAPEFHTAPS